MIDSHTHLDSCAPPNAELVASARAMGVTHILTVGMDADSCRTALAAAHEFPEVWAAVGRHPNNATGFDDAVLADLRELAADPRCAAIGETGLDFFRDYASREDQERAFHAQIELAGELGKPLIIHTRAAENATIDTLRERAAGVTVILHCFSMPAWLDVCLAEGWWISFAGNVTYPKNDELAAAAAAVPENRLLVETDAPYLTPQPLRKERNQPAYVTETAQFLAEARGVTYAELDETVERNAATVFGWR
jgi:TatD DNase family protein